MSAPDRYAFVVGVILRELRDRAKISQGDLAARVLQQEHIIYPRAVRDLLEGRAWLDGERVRRKS